METKVIGITGGIGSGKSTVARLFSVMGYPVYYSDERAKELYFISSVRNKVENLLGKEVYIDNISLNKKLIAHKIFSHKALLDKLNAIIHPAVLEDFYEWKEKHTEHKFVFFESALLFETGLHKVCFKNILVTAPEETRIKRVMKRDGLTHDEVSRKVKTQLNDDVKKKSADFIIDNSGEQLIIPEVLAWIRLQA